MKKKINPNSLANLKPAPPAPIGNKYRAVSAQRRARIQQLCTMEPSQLTSLKGRTVYDEMIIRMLRSKNPRDHELIMKADAPGLLRDEVDVRATLMKWSDFVNSDTDPDTETDNEES
jgi:hypothetical protein